jgi:mono/diheme cytochrome c family protein
MKSDLRIAAATAIALGLSAPAWAQEPNLADFGKAIYESTCASCHGVSAKGDGTLSAYLTKAPSDLTTLARRNGGTFPMQLVWEMIDGRSGIEIGPHGTRAMPVWGQEFRQQALRNPSDAPRGPEWYVRGRIVALLDYLARIQVK